MKTKNELIKRIKKQAAEEAKRKNNAKINWLSFLGGVIMAIILFFAISWSAVFGATKMTMFIKIVILPLGIAADITMMSLLIRITLGDLALYIMGRRAQKSRKYFLPLLKKALLDFDNLKQGNEIAKLFSLFQIEILFWQEIILKHTKITNDSSLRKWYWEKSLQFKFAKLKYSFSEHLKCYEEQAPVINYAPYFVNQINLFFNFGEIRANGQTMAAELTKEFGLYANKAKIELNEWLDRNIAAIMLEAKTIFGEAEVDKPIWQQFIATGNTFNFYLK
jgi:hypothetical protein